MSQAMKELGAHDAGPISGALLFYVLGAQKAGTTWLYQQLRASGLCHTRTIKEAHYFDALHGPDGHTHIERRGALLRDRAAALTDALARGDRDAAERLQTDLRRRLEHLAIYTDRADGGRAYRRWLMAGWSGQPVVADITPGYAVLGADVLAEMRRMAERSRFLMILRDPVDRLWSSIKMYARNRLGGGAEEAGAVARNFAQGKRDIPTLNRNDYAATLATMEAAVPASERLVVFFEGLMSQTGLDRVAAFLGLSGLVANVDQRPNRSADWPLPTDLAAGLFAALAPQYAHVAARYPDTLPPRWRARMEAFG